tara:strand:- start:138 stop:692 length:555 start_codon:yes stop_codon:yes gene_type:complete
MFKEIYLDLDGVLADFFSEWKNITGRNWWELDNNLAAIQKIRDEKNFWLKLPLLSNSLKLLKILKDNNQLYHILSSPLQNDQNCISQKKKWVKNMLKFYPPQKVIISSEKEIYAKDNLGLPNVLIDDFGVNIKRWENNGGIGIKHKDHKFKRTKEKLLELIDMKYQNFQRQNICIKNQAPYQTE